MNPDSAPHNLPAESRPSLLGGGARLVDRVNILEAVDAKPKKGPSLSPLLGVVLLVGVGLSAALGAVHWLRSSDLANSPLASTQPAEVQLAAVAAAPAVASAPRAEAAPSVAQTPPTPTRPVAADPVASAAPAVAVASAPAPVVAAPVAAAPPPAPPIRIAAAPAPQAAAPAAKPEPTRAKASTAVAAAAPRDAAQATQSALRSLAAPPQVVAVATRPSTAPAPSSEARASQQKPDVELINAIMRHVSQSTDNGITISGLVKQCMNSDDIESLMCRRRVCDGNWGNSSACPMAMAPRAARSAALAAQ